MLKTPDTPSVATSLSTGDRQTVSDGLAGVRFLQQLGAGSLDAITHSDSPRPIVDEGETAQLVSLTAERIIDKRDAFEAIDAALQAIEDDWAIVAGKSSRGKKAARQRIRAANREIDRCVCEIYSIRPIDDEGNRTLALISARNYLSQKPCQAFYRGVLGDREGDGYGAVDDTYRDSRMRAANDYY